MEADTLLAGRAEWQDKRKSSKWSASLTLPFGIPETLATLPSKSKNPIYDELYLWVIVSLKSEQNLSYPPNHRTPRTDSASPLGPWLSVLKPLGCRGGTKASELIALSPLFPSAQCFISVHFQIFRNSSQQPTTDISPPLQLPALLNAKRHPSFIFHWRSEIEKTHCGNHRAASVNLLSFPPPS